MCLCATFSDDRSARPGDRPGRRAGSGRPTVGWSGGREVGRLSRSATPEILKGDPEGDPGDPEGGAGLQGSFGSLGDLSVTSLLL